MTCPKCGGHEWKLASVVHAGGISTISTTSIGVGAGVEGDAFGGGAGLGAGVSKTSGTQQTALSKLAAPPRKPMRSAVGWGIFGLMTMVIGIVFFHDMRSDENPIFTKFLFVFAPLTILVAIGRVIATPEISKSINKQHELALIEYARKKMCMQCGTIFIEDAPARNEMRKCPSCAESVRAQAIKCRFCQVELTPIPEASPQSPQPAAIDPAQPSHQTSPAIRNPIDLASDATSIMSASVKALNTGKISIAARILSGLILGYKTGKSIILIATYFVVKFQPETMTVDEMAD